MKKDLENIAFKIQDWIISLYVLVSFIIIGVDSVSIVYYQFIDYRPSAVIVACVSLYIMIHLNKEVRG